MVFCILVETTCPTFSFRRSVAASCSLVITCSLIALPSLLLLGLLGCLLRRRFFPRRLFRTLLGCGLPVRRLLGPLSRGLLRLWSGLGLTFCMAMERRVQSQLALAR